MCMNQIDPYAPGVNYHFPYIFWIEIGMLFGTIIAFIMIYLLKESIALIIPEERENGAIPVGATKVTDANVPEVRVVTKKKKKRRNEDSVVVDMERILPINMKSESTPMIRPSSAYKRMKFTPNDEKIIDMSRKPHYDHTHPIINHIYEWWPI